MYNYSIIIPHKNIPSLLQRCLNSIPERDDIQVIIVDDNSAPDIVNFNSFPGSFRKNCTLLFPKEGKGAGYARNLALSYVKGKWILFIDADDYFSDNFLDICDTNLNSDADIVFMNSESVYSDSLLSCDNRDKTISMFLESSDFNILRYCSHVIWGKMFKNQLVETHSIRFDEVASANDVMFAGKCGLVANKVMFENQILLYSTIRPDSITFKKKSLASLISYVDVALRYNHFLDTNKIYYGYWMNPLGHILRLLPVKFSLFFKYMFDYLLHTNIFRIFLDVKESFINVFKSSK